MPSYTGFDFSAACLGTGVWARATRGPPVADGRRLVAPPYRLSGVAPGLSPAGGAALPGRLAAGGVLVVVLAGYGGGAHEALQPGAERALDAARDLAHGVDGLAPGVVCRVAHR